MKLVHLLVVVIIYHNFHKVRSVVYSSEAKKCWC